MKGVEIFQRFWTVDDVKESPDKIFVFGDNNARIGKGGQAIIRGCSNTIGIRTKKGPSNKSAAFYNDNEYDINCKFILEDVLKIREQLILGKTIVFSKDGYGTGLADLKKMAPKTFDFLVDILRDFFEFDNCSGNVWKKTPSIDDVNGAKYIDFSKSNNDILIPVNNSFFKDEYLSLNLNSNYDLIKFDKKVSFLSNFQLLREEYLMLKFEGFKNYLFVKVCVNSYLCDRIEKTSISNFEGYSESFFENIDLGTYYQTQIKYICEIDDKGKIIFKKDLFSQFLPKVKSENKTTGQPIFYVKKKEEKSSFFKNPFKKTIEQLLSEKNLLGDIKKIPDTGKGENYQVKVGTDYYFIVFHKNLFTNSIEILSINKTPFI